MNDKQQLPDLPTWCWLWFPPLMIILVYCFRASSLELYNSLFEYEHGIIELATPIAAFIGMGFGIAALRYHRLLADCRLGLAWLGCCTLGCLYLGGEEISWGQWLFFWETPEAIRALNDQQETNLHNMSSWLDQKPRLLLEVWVVIGGIVLPLKRRFSASPLTDTSHWSYWFWPRWVMLPTAVLVVLSKLPERYLDITGAQYVPLRIRYSELQEYYFALFLALFLASAWMRLRLLNQTS